MLRIVIPLWFVACAYGLTCSVCGHSDCCASDACSIHCRGMGRAGGYCKFSELEDRCICYCYRGTHQKMINITRLEKFSKGCFCYADNQQFSCGFIYSRKLCCKGRWIPCPYVSCPCQ